MKKVHEVGSRQHIKAKQWNRLPRKLEPLGMWYFNRQRMQESSSLGDNLMFVKPLS
jgi:hypothetical protein